MVKILAAAAAALGMLLSLATLILLFFILLSGCDRHLFTASCMLPLLCYVQHQLQHTHSQLHTPLPLSSAQSTCAAAHSHCAYKTNLFGS